MKEPLRAGFIIDSLMPGAGTENQLALILEHLDRSQVQPHLVVHQDAPELPRARISCPVTVLGFRKMAGPAGVSGLFKLAALARKEKWDVLVTFFRDANLIGTLAASMARVPVVSNRRNLGAGYWHTPWELRKLRVLNRLTRLWVANSEAVKTYTAQVEGVDPARLRVIPNAVDLARFTRPEPRAGLRAEAGLPREGLVVTCVANLRPIKGVDVLVEAFCLMAAEAPEAVLVLVGEGELRPGLEDRVGRAGLQKRVRFLGSRPDIERILAASDIGVLPSRGEGSPNAILEYLAAGLPVAASNVGGVPELLGGGTAGVLVPPEDPQALAEALLRLITGPEDRSSLAGRGRELLEERHGLDPVLEAWYRVLMEAGSPKN